MDATFGFRAKSLIPVSTRPLLWGPLALLTVSGVRGLSPAYPMLVGVGCGTWLRGVSENRRPWTKLRSSQPLDPALRAFRVHQPTRARHDCFSTSGNCSSPGDALCRESPAPGSALGRNSIVRQSSPVARKHARKRSLRCLWSSRGRLAPGIGAGGFRPPVARRSGRVSA